MANDKGLIFVISAPSGCGKTSLIKALLRRRSDLVHPTSFTTRPRRSGEKESVDYNFISGAEFKKRLNKGDFLEWSRPFGYCYATPRKSIFDAIRQGKDVILSLDVKGATFVKRKLKNVVLIYVLPPSFKALRQRLVDRSTDNLIEILKRLKFAKKDTLHLNKYDYTIVNDNFKEAVGKLNAILIAERFKVRR